MKIMKPKQTAVEWFAEQDTEATIEFLEGKISQLQFGMRKIQLLEQAKQMEKEQIQQSWIDGMKSISIAPFEDDFYQIETEQYYNEKYNQ